MSKRQKTRLEKLLRHKPRHSEQPIFIREPLSKELFYNGILQRILYAEELLQTTREDRIGKPLRVVYEVFPLVDTIAYNLFNKPGRYYLERLGYSRREADIMVRMFRNGHTHNGSSYRLEYDDGEVTWGLTSSGGSGGPMPYYPGYIDEKYPEYNEPHEKVFDYIDMEDGSYHASLAVDRLLAHIKYDIENRLQNDISGDINRIVGQQVKGRRRKATRKLSDSDE